METNGEISPEIRQKIVEAIKLGKPYTSDAAYPYLISAQENTQNLAHVLRDANWTRSADPRSKTETYVDPKFKNTITLTQANIGEYVHELNLEVRQEILKATRDHLDYATPEARLGLQRIGTVTPGEVQQFRGTRFVDDLKIQFENLGWAQSRDARTLNITFTNPVTGKKITYNEPYVPMGGMRTHASPEENTAIADALEHGRDYITPGATEALQWKGKAKPEELQRLRDSRFVDDFADQFKNLGWVESQDARTLNITFTNPVTGKKITYNEPYVPIGGMRTRASPEENVMISDAVEHAQDYVTPSASEALQWRGKAKPEELQRLRDIRFVDDFAGQFKNLGWAESRDSRSNITFTNPVTGKKITYNEPYVPIGGMRTRASPEENAAIADAVEHARDYVNPRATEAMQWIGKAKPEELQHLQSTMMYFELEDLMTKQMGWKSKENAREGTVTFTNPKFKNKITVSLSKKKGQRFETMPQNVMSAIFDAVRDNTDYTAR
jgi:fructose-specific component phosphotransferase system IIB-like protein